MKSNKPFQRIFKKGSKTYYYSSLFFPKPIKDDVFIFYSYVRTADDFVDAIPQKKKQFLEFKTITYKLLDNPRLSIVPKYLSSQEMVVIRSFVQLSVTYSFDVKWTKAFLEAMESDMKKATYKSFAELETYMHGSAEVIGLFMCSILHIPTTAHKYARLQGKAMQLINFIRDIAEDIELKRQYLPTNDMKQFKLTHIPPLKSESESFNRYIRYQIERYFKIQKEAERGFTTIPNKNLIMVRTSAEMYMWTARQIYKNPHIVFEKKMKPPTWYIIFSVIKNLVRSYF